MEIMIEIIKFVQSLSNPFLDFLFQLVTMMGEEEFNIIVVTLFLWCIQKDFGYRLGFAYLSSGIINTVLKDIFRIPRVIGHPEIRSLRVETATGYSFPSGHTQFTTSLWTSLAIQFRRKWIYAVGALIIMAVALSRLYLGVHTPLDVVGGFLIGAAWIFAANWIFDAASKSKNKAFLMGFILPMLIGLWFFRNDAYYKLAGTLLGYFIGYVVESRYIDYQVKAVLWKQALKFSVGMLGTVLLRAGLKALLPPGLLSDFFRYLLIALWITVGAPFIFKTMSHGFSSTQEAPYDVRGDFH